MLKLSSRLAIAMVSLVLVTTIALGLITYQNLTRLSLPRSLDRLETHALLNATQLEAALNTARADLTALRSTGAVADFGTAYMQSLVDPSAGDASRMWARRFAVRLSAELLAKSHYAQMRVIGRENNGRELVRVDRSGPDGAIRVVPDDELASVGHEFYYKAAIDRSARDIYVSPVVLQPATDATGGMPSPMVRFAASLRASDGKTFAVGVIDVDLQSEFDRIRASMASGRQIFIVNEQGDCLLGPEAASSPAAAMDMPARIQNRFPNFEQAMANGQTNGIWIDRSGARSVVGWAPVQLAGGPRLTVIEAASYPAINVGFAAVGNSTLVGGGLAVLCAIGVALLLARSLSRPLVEITRAVEGFSRGEAIQLSPGGGKEIQVLSAALTNMAADVRQQASLLNNVISTIADPVLVANEHGVIVIANPAAQRMFDARPGVSIVPNTNVSFSLLCPDHVTPFPLEQSAIAQALRRKSVDNLHLVVRPADGEDRDIVVSGRPIIDETGELRGAVTIYHDITRNLKAQEAQFASEQMAQAIIDTALDAFIQIDSHGKILLWSPKAETMLGWSRDEVIGKNLLDLSICGDKHINSQERIAQVLGSLDSGVTGWRYETVTLRRDRTEIVTEVSLTALRQRDDVIINTFLRDISQRRVAEDQLRQAQKMESVGELTGGLAHDFNNMLTVITGTIDILADAVADEPQLAAIAALISGAADRGAELTANLLAFARKQPLQPRATDVNSLMVDVCKLLHPTLGRQIEVETALGTDVWPALVDPGQLSSALVNLAINARDAMPDGGKLALTTGNFEVAAQDVSFKGILAPGSYVKIDVRDTGTGMSDATLEKVFEPFFSTKEPGRGTGLGLSMVYGFVKQSGGHIEAVSELGRGTTFRIYLPKAVEQPNLATDAPADTRTSSGHETILCVEDDASVRSFVLTQLQSLGYRTVAAANAAEALAIVERGEAFDLLFTDIVMPGKMNGRQLAEAAAALRPGLKVLFTSGFTENDDVINQSRINGDVLLLPKPYRRADLNRMIRLALESPTPAVILGRRSLGLS